MTAPIAFSSIWHISTIFFIFIFGIILSVYLGKRLYNNQLRSVFLYFYHTIWCLCFFWYSNVNGADSWAYYYSGVAGEGEFRFGTDFVILFVSCLDKYLGLSYFGIFLVFNIIGTLGYIFFDSALRYANVGSGYLTKYLSLIVILLPSVSFWSSAISKDAISFLAVGASLWAAIKLKERMLLMILSIVLMLTVRPHMASILIMSLTVAVFFDRSTSGVARFFLSVMFIFAAYIMIPFALDYAGVKDGGTINSISDYIDKRQSYFLGGSAIDLTSMNFFEKTFTYGFRPTLLEARSIFYFAASLDNMILLYLFVYGLWLALRMKLSSYYGNKLFMFSYPAVAWVILSLTTPNLGIALRQKWMFTPFIIYLAISYISKKNADKSFNR